MGLRDFLRRSQQTEGRTALGVYLSGDGSLPRGYHRLLDSPEVGACINRIAAVISSGTIYLMRNDTDGDKRVRNGLSRLVDIDPWPQMATRQSWLTWIITELLGRGDGNAYVLPGVSGGRFTKLEPMPGASASRTDTAYRVDWRGRQLAPDEILHFRLFADSDEPWRGRGYKAQAAQLAASLKQTTELKDRLSSPDYKPPMIVSIASDADFADDGKRKELRKRYLEDTDKGEPWILPAELIKVEQVKPLSLTDLAIKDNMELDKRTAAAIFGVPPFLLGLGAFNQQEYNNFVRTVIIPICEGIEQELTLKLLMSEEMYYQFNRRRLYAYDLKQLIDIDLAMSDRGFMTGDEVREDAFRDPAGLTEFRVLENYIPDNMVDKQKKLVQTPAEGEE